MQTDVVQVLVWSAAMSQSRSGLRAHLRRLAGAAGDDDDVRVRDVGERGVGPQGESAGLVGDSTGSFGQEEVFAPGSWTSTWNGPTASRAVNRSNRGMAISMMLLSAGCRF